MFFRLVNGQPEELELPLRVGGQDVFTNDPTILARHGYYPLTMEEYPNDGKDYRIEYVLEDGEIKGRFVEVSMDVSEPTI